MLYDDEGRTCVVLKRPTLADLVDRAIAQPRRYGAADPAVMTRIVVLLRELAWCVPTEQHDVVVDQLARLRATVAAQDYDDTERGQLDELADGIEHALHGRWS